jgi:hypothetical protein
MKTTKTLGAIITLALLAGCATSVPVKNFEQNKIGHLRTNFGASEVPAEIAAAIAREVPSAERFTQIVFKLRMDYDGKASTSGFDYTITVINLGKGLRQELWESSNNGIAHGTEMRLSHLALIPIKAQYAHHGSTHSTEITTAKSVSISQPGIAQPAEGRTYEYEYKLGGPIQFVNLFTSTNKCAAGKTYDASTLHANLVGKAIDLECEISVDGKVRSKNTTTFFLEYGIAIRKGWANSEGKGSYRVIDVQVS